LQVARRQKARGQAKPAQAEPNLRIACFKADCLRVEAILGQQRLPAPALAYLDPPFLVGADFNARALGKTRAEGELAYTDTWASEAAYFSWLEARLRAVWSVLAPAGSMWLHLDHRAVHEAKVLCDKITSKRAFQGEIIWVPGNGAKSRKGLPVTHQTILVYAKGPALGSGGFCWNGQDPCLREPYAKTSLSMHFTNVDKDGRAYRERTIGKRTYRYYADQGRALGSVWTDCGAMQANTPLRKEATGYPTQKPLSLLTRIIRAATQPGECVLDAFAGSGTTLEAAYHSGRSAIGFDIGELAHATQKKRLSPFGAEFVAIQ
jgi:site-specific DNA-methyltransferase (adenine-specific)